MLAQTSEPNSVADPDGWEVPSPRGGKTYSAKIERKLGREDPPQKLVITWDKLNLKGL